MAARKAPMAEHIDDPSGHFPYKIDRALRAVREDAPAGPDGPDDDRVRTGDFLDEAIAQATNEYVQAQAEHFRTDTAETLEVMQAAAERLVEARRAHRDGRGDAPTVTAVRAPRANG